MPKAVSCPGCGRRKLDLWSDDILWESASGKMVRKVYVCPTCGDSISRDIFVEAPPDIEEDTD